MFTPGAATGGPLRPVPLNGIAPGSITGAQIAPGSLTATQLAPGTVGAGQIDPNQLQIRVTGVCPVGQYLRGIAPNGSVVCEPLLSPHASTTVDDNANNVGFFTSIAIGVDGVPVISHLDTTAGALRVSKCATKTCQ